MRARKPLLRVLLVVLEVDLGVLGPLLGELVLGEAGVHWAGLDAGVAVDALVRIDEELLRVVIVRLVRRRMDAVDGADLYAGVVLLADAGLRDDVCQGVCSFPGRGCDCGAHRGRGTQHFRPAGLSAHVSGEPARPSVCGWLQSGPVILLTGATGVVGGELLPALL